MSIGRKLLIALAITIIFALPTIALAQSPTTIKGTVNYNGTYVPIASDQLWVQLRSGDLVLAEQKLSIGGTSPPYNFTLPTVNLTTNGTYLIVAELGHANQIRRYLGQTSITITSNNLTAGPITMGLRGGRLGDTSSGALRLLVGVILAVLAGILALWRRRRMQALVRRLA